MKKFVVLLVVIGMLFCLSGCSGLEELRKQQAFVGENGEILWNGNVYKALPGNEYMYVEFDNEGAVYLTAPDVPVLLSVICMEQFLMPSEDGVLLSEIEPGTYYCREDRYEDILSRMQEEFVPDVVCYSYKEYPETEYYTLTKEQVETIDLVLQNTEPTVLGDGMYMEWDYFVDLQAYSADRLFCRDSTDISDSGTTYYLHQYTDEQEQVFTVPEAYSQVFAEITRAYIEEMAAYEAEMEEFF